MSALERGERSSCYSNATSPDKEETAAHPLFNEVCVRTLQRHEVPTACAMYVENGEWTTVPSLEFHLALYDAYPDGWLCATIGDAIVGTMFFATFPDGSGFGGYFFVRKDYRSKGVGKRLQDACLLHFTHANFGINAMEDRVAANLRAGYKIVSFRLLAFCGPADVGAAARRAMELQCAQVSLTSIRKPSEELLRYDGEMNAARRDVMVTLYTALENSYTLVARRRGVIAGYGTLHKCPGFYQISPLYADDLSVAELILTSLVSRMPGGSNLCYTAPALNAASVALAEKYKLPFAYATVRQYTKSEVALPLHNIYSIATEDASFA